MSSVHISQLAAIPNPRLNQVVHREECTQCFDNQDLAEGIDVCLSCFNGGCVGLDETRKHAQLHSQKTGHPFSLNIRRKLKPSSRRDSSGPPLKKLAIIEEREEDKYEFETTIRCWTYNNDNGKLMPELSDNQEVQRLSTAVMQSMSSARQSEVKSWEEEIMACEHTLTIQQHELGAIPPSGKWLDLLVIFNFNVLLGLAQCAKCDIKDNLWLCLTCGSLGCGRQQFGGIKGNGHGLQHYEESQHPVSVKLGTITPEGNADIFCYKCGDSKLDPDLPRHLSAFGINIATQTKTEKSITELQIEQNLKFDFSLTGEDGKALEPVFGPGLTGLRNLGNSCYMASTLQMIFSLPSFKNQYLNTFYDHARTCTEPFPANCIDCQMCKAADGLLSGRYSVARSNLSAASQTTAVSEPMTIDGDPLVHLSPSPVFQEGIKPIMFKALIGRGHAEFATMRQQDAEEFLAHLLKTLRQQARRTGKTGSDATDVFKFGMQQRLECGVCHGVKYRVDEHDVLSLGVEAKEVGRDEDGKTQYASVELLDCISDALGVEDIEYRCSRCDRNIFAKKQTLFATFPDVLVVHAKKFQLIKWVPAKLDIPVQLPSGDVLTLDKFLGKGVQEGEDILPEDASNQPTVQETSFNAAALEQLQTMGFPLVRCQKALLATGNNNAEVAMEWLFAHMDDPDIDEPIRSQSSTNPNTASTASPEQISMLSDMGFTAAQAQKALRETGGDMERAVEWLFNHPDDTGEDNIIPPASSSGQTIPTTTGGSATLPATFRLKAFISHKGPSVHSGHYVAHIRTGRGWTLFNDEKVVKADDESVEQLKKLAYLYIFERVKDA